MCPAMNQLLMSFWSQIKAYLYIIVCISHPSYAVYRPWWSVIFRILSSLRLSFDRPSVDVMCIIHRRFRSYY